jgi:Cu(I)/Ag(I) efflux system membrane protein CusA/SilA
MIDRIIEFSARNRFLVMVFVVALVWMGWWSMQNVALDAIPDLSDPQVIIYSRWDRSPDIIEDQVTYPIVTALLGAPRVKDIRGFSDFGYSYVYVIFEEGTDLYWARSRAIEYLSKITPQLPAGVRTELGPDATGVGWVFQYALVDRTGQHSLADLRSFQDWNLRYHLQSLPGVAEVAPIGGFVRQYQVNVDPNALSSYNIPMERVVDAIRRSNNDVGGRLVEFSGREYMVRGRGYARTAADLESVVLGANPQTGAPVLVRNVGQVVLGPDIRRGIAELNGEGEVVGGVVVMRHGENALHVIEQVKAKLDEIRPALPPGVEVVTTYDRGELIERSIETLKITLTEELIIVSVVILIFLWHFPSAMIPIITIPVTVIIAFIPMRMMGITANIMSLGGIAVAIGAMVDAAIVVVEQTHKKLEHWEATGRKENYESVIITAVKEVGGPSFFALLVIAVSFLPVFALQAQEGRLFKPLAYTKNFAMVIAALLAITLDPALRLALTHMRNFNFRPRWMAAAANAVLVGKIHSEEKHPISRPLMRIYHPMVRLVLRHPWTVIAVAVLIVVVSIPVYFKLGSEFMPPLNEGVVLDMPITMPGISVTEAGQVLQMRDRMLRQFPEVATVFGKIGRAESSTDPAPFSMLETTVVLKPQSKWRYKKQFYSAWPGWTQSVLRRIWPDRMSYDELVAEMDSALQIPGMSNVWTMPIRNRIDMLTTGVRSPVGVKIFGSDLAVIERIGIEVEQALRQVPGTRNAFAERTTGGYFLDFDFNREQLARYGLTVDDVQMYVMSAVGGENVTTTVEGRERYPVNVRYQRDFRSDLEQLNRVLVTTPAGYQVPMAQLAELRMVSGPGMIRNENGLLSGYVYTDVAGRDLGRYVEDARRVVAEKVALPTGYTLAWSGQYEYLERVKERLTVIVPITLFIVFLLLYVNTGSTVKTFIILLAVPFSAVGALWLLYLLDYNISIAVWVGLIALLGVDAETAVFMLLYLDLAFEERKREGKMLTREDLHEAIETGAVKRLRPKVMTVAVMFMGLLPIMWSVGTGADVMKRIAAPMIGGIFTSFLMELLVYPAIYFLWKWHAEVKRAPQKPLAGVPA